MSVSVLAHHTCQGTGEGPYWEESTQSLLYVDIQPGEVHKWNAVTGDTKVNIGGYASFVIPRQKGGYMVSRERAIGCLDWDSQQFTEILSVDSGTSNRLNDAKCDASGRLWAGTMGNEPQPAIVERHMGSLYSLDSDLKLRSHKDKIDLSNGLGWTADNRTMFFVDSVPRELYAFDFDIESGNISNERTVLSFAPDTMNTHGYPDGLSMDLDDKIWLACYSVGKVIRIDPETGKELQTIKFPALNTTSCCFGGPDYTELYVTCSKRNVTDEELATTQPEAGSVFRVTGLGARGKASPMFAG